MSGKRSPEQVLEVLAGELPVDKAAAAIGESPAAVEEARELVTEAQVADAPAIAGLPALLAEGVLLAAVRRRDVQLLKAVATEGGREVAKAARKALHRLRSQGVEVGELKPAPEPVVRAAPPPEDLTAYATPIDGQGDRALWIPRPQRGGGLWLVMAVVSDARGLVHVSGGETTRKGIREMLRRANERVPAIAPRPIGPDRARGIAAAALDRARARGEVPERAELVDDLRGDPALAAPPAASEPPLPPGEEAELAASGGALHDEPEIAAWFPEEDFLRAMALKFDETSTSVVIVNERQRIERYRQVLARSVDDYFNPARRASYAGRLFEMAEWLRATDRDGAGRRAAATARALAAGDGRAARGFMERMLNKLVVALDGTSGEGEPPKPERAGGLIVPP